MSEQVTPAEARLDVVVLSPHLDDAVYSAWAAVAAGALVATFCTAYPTRGTVTVSDRVAGASDSFQLMELRRTENRKVLGRHRDEVVELGFLDSQYTDTKPDPATFADAVRDLVAGKIVYAPLGLGGHPDHVAVRDAALMLADSIPEVRLFADMPYAVRYGWPAWVTGRADVEPHLDAGAAWQCFLESLPAFSTMTPRIVRVDRAAKEADMRGYATQWPSLNNGDIGRLENPAVAGIELYWV